MPEEKNLAEKFVDAVGGVSEVPDMDEHVAQSGVYVLGLQADPFGAVYVLGAFSSIEAATQAIPTNVSRYEKSDPTGTYTTGTVWEEESPLVRTLPIYRNGTVKAHFHVTICPLNRY